MLKNLDKKQKIELTITGIGILFLIFMLIGTLQRSGKKRASIIDTDVKVSSSLSTPISFKAPRIQESIVAGGWKRDPFFFGASGVSASSLEGLVLNGIMWDAQNPYAIINNDVVKVGDRVGGARVGQINEKSVVLELDGERYILKLDAF